MSPAIQGDYISDLDALPNIFQLVGALFEIDVPTGPVAGAYVSRRVTADQYVAYVASKGFRTELPSFQTVRFRTRAEADANFGGEVLEELSYLSLFTYAHVLVEFWRDNPQDLSSPGRAVELIAVFDPNADSDHMGWRTSGGAATFAGQVGLQLVPLTSPEATGVLRFDSTHAVEQGTPCFYDDGQGVKFYEALQDMASPVPAPVRGVTTQFWRPIDPPTVPGGGTPTVPGTSNMAQLTNTSVAQYVDVFLENKAAQLASVEGLANYAGQQMQLIDPANNAPFASESAYLPDVQASLAAAWATGVTRLLLRCQVLPLRNGLVAHAKLTFSQAVTTWLQTYAPHASGFRLFGTAFQLQNVDWTHAGGMQVTGSNLYNAGAPSVATGSPQAGYAGGGTGLLMALEFTHNKQYSFYDYVGLSEAQAPNNSTGANFACCFYITQGQNWIAQVGGVELAKGSLLGTQFRMRLEVYDDHVNWLVDGAVVYTMIGSLTATNLWPSVTLGQNSGISNCLFGGQTTSPR